MTPEGKVKRGIKAVLDKHGKHVYIFMPVPGGYGRSTLDYIGICCGCGFAIEAKREGGKPTDRQLGIIGNIERAGGKVFVINADKGLTELNDWLTTVVSRNMEQR